MSARFLLFSPIIKSSFWIENPLLAIAHYLYIDHCILHTKLKNQETSYSFLFLEDHMVNIQTWGWFLCAQSYINVLFDIPFVSNSCIAAVTKSCIDSFLNKNVNVWFLICIPIKGRHCYEFKIIIKKLMTLRIFVLVPGICSMCCKTFSLFLNTNQLILEIKILMTLHHSTAR